MTPRPRPRTGWGGAHRALHCALAALLSCAAACWSTPVEVIPDSNSAYDVLPEAAGLRFDEARRSLEAGQPELAQPVLAELALQFPDNIVVGIWLQEVEIASIPSLAALPPAPQSPASLPGAAPSTPALELTAIQTGASPMAASGAGLPRDPRLDALRQRYRSAAEERPSVARFVLAARLEDDELAADLLLGRAQGIDPRCAWVHYARAWFAARANRWPEVKSEIAIAKEADPGHMPTRWLEAWMLARGGEVREAISVLEGWLDKARGDLRLDTRMVREAELDLALLSILVGDPQQAREILDGLADGEVDPGRKWTAIAPTEQALDHEREALAAAQRAETNAPGEILPVVQQALLYESWLGQPEAAEAAWTRALALARGSSDLGALLERVRARVHVERLRAEREAKQHGPSSN